MAYVADIEWSLKRLYTPDRLGGRPWGRGGRGGRARWLREQHQWDYEIKNAERTARVSIGLSPWNTCTLDWDSYWYGDEPTEYHIEGVYITKQTSLASRLEIYREMTEGGVLWQKKPTIHFSEVEDILKDNSGTYRTPEERVEALWEIVTNTDQRDWPLIQHAETAAYNLTVKTREAEDRIRREVMDTVQGWTWKQSY